MPELDAALAALQMAIQTEIDAYNFYMKFAGQTTDPQARAMFERIAQDEVVHLELLRNNKATLEDQKEWIVYQAMAMDSIPGAPIFSRGRVDQNIVGYTSDMSALRVAYLIEKDAVEFYRRAAAQTEDPNGKRMFLDLVRWEQGHLQLLEGEYNFLKSQFQAAMGFAPF